MDLRRDDVEAATTEEFDHATRTCIRKGKVVRFDQNQCLLDVCSVREIDRSFEQTAVAVGVLRPQLEVALSTQHIWRSKHSRFEVTHVALRIRKIVAVS